MPKGPKRRKAPIEAMKNEEHNPVPTEPEQPGALPEHEGLDSIGVYSFDNQAVFWTDAAGRPML